MASTTRSLTSVSPGRFFLLTYVLSWLIWAPLVASRFDLIPVDMAEGTRNLLGLFGVLMPATSALILTARAGGRSEVGSLLSRLRIWRVGAWWWAAAVLLQPMLLIVAGGGANLLFGSTEVPWTTPDSVGYLIVTVIFLLIAVLGEEIGWRGVALPALQQRTSVLVASLVLGVLWAGWHLPFWLLQDSYTQFGPGYLGLNLLLIVPFSAYISWFFNATRYSVLLPVCFHLAFNILNATLFQVTMSIPGFGILIALEWVLGLLLLPRLDRRNPRAPGATAG
jgi:membrane protease YdiL (CAAX protease family)